MPQRHIDGASVVFLGSFNPKIFQPFWFSTQRLIRPEEAEKADVNVVHTEISQFSIGWVDVQVTADRFTAATKKDPVLMRDLVLGTFQILEHTPVRAMGLNRDVHYSLDSEADWHRLGDRLAPKDRWKEVLSAEPRPGLKTLTIEGKRPGSSAAFTRVKVEPSIRVAENGIYIQVNEQHGDLASDPTAEKLQTFLQIIGREWDAVQDFASTIAERVVSWSRD